MFPGASACVARWEQGAWSYIDAVAGTRAEGSDSVGADTIYDLASLTKPWVATAALRLFQAGVFELGARVDELIRDMGLTRARHRAVGEFSKGMARRVGLAQALLNDPDLVLLDEPTSGLDPLGCR